MEDNILEMPILEQMFYFRKEDFEQAIYEKESEIREIEDKVFNYNEELMELLKEIIPNKEDLEKIEKMLQGYEFEFSKEIDFWSKAYYKLGINDMHKLKCELKNLNTDINKDN